MMMMMVGSGKVKYINSGGIRSLNDMCIADVVAMVLLLSKFGVQSFFSLS